MADFKTPSAIDVALFIMKMAAVEGIDLSSQKRLQKLLYYVQGHSLGMRDKPAFREDVKAWRDGPVVREVYDFLESKPRSMPVGLGAELEELDKAFIASIWEDYKYYTEAELIERTHCESPWLNARGKLRSHEPSDILIPPAAMREFFGQPAAYSLSDADLHHLAMRSDTKPPDSWYDEPDATGVGN